MATPAAPTGTDDERKPVPLQLRLDPALHAEAKALAERAGISLNQLASGLLRWGVENAVVGEPDIPPDTKFVGKRDVPGCVFFGSLGHVRHYPDGHPKEDDPEVESYGRVVFGLDFSGRGLVRWNHHPPAPRGDG